jgi:assimilatory nitrate reductase catalytic subunit
MSRTGKLAQLFNHVDEPRLALHADDMARRGLADGDFALASSRRGAVVLRVGASDEMRPGQAFLPMHWGRRHLNSAGANELTLAALDPHSKQPELKHAAIQVEKVALPHHALALRMARGPESADRAQAWLNAAQPLLARFRYASLGLSGREEPVLVLRAAHDEPIPRSWLDAIDQGLDLPDWKCLSYADAKRGISKRALIEDGLLTGLRLTGETAAGAWLKDAMLEQTSAEELRRWLFAPLAAAPLQGRSRGRVVCNCFNVGEIEIGQEIAAGATLEALQEKLCCGTSCGSCLPELKRMIAGTKAAA